MSETLWQEASAQVELNKGILILDDSNLEKPYSKFNALVYQHWSGKQKEVVSGINLITLLWTNEFRCIPIDYRVFDKDPERLHVE
jgi:putative transposase